MDEIDFAIQQWPDETSNFNNNNNGNYMPRGNKNPRGGTFTPGSGVRTPNSKPNSTPNSGVNTPRGRGRGWGRGRGQEIFEPSSDSRGRGSFDHSPSFRGRGRGSAKLRADAPLSKLLWQERPLLKPIVFVRSVHTATLFEEKDEVFKPIVESAGDEEASHVPTADRVARVFSGNIPRLEDADGDEDSEEALEEIDFSDLAKLAELPAVQAGPTEMDGVEEKFTGIRVESEVIETDATAIDSQVTAAESVSEKAETTCTTEATIISTQSATAISMSVDQPPEATIQPPMPFFVDLQPSEPLASSMSADEPSQPPAPFFVDASPAGVSPAATSSVIFDRLADSVPIGGQSVPDDDDEVIVYVAPHPRTSHQHPPRPSISSKEISSAASMQAAQPAVELQALNGQQTSTSENLGSQPGPSFESVSFSFSPSPRKQPRHAPVFTAGARSKAATKARVREARAARKRTQRSGGFSSFGAMLSEAQLRERDPRLEQRRRGDSDVDWGDSDSDDGDGLQTSLKDGITQADDDAGGMDLDPDLELNIEDLKNFVKGMGAGGSQFVTMDDIPDEDRMREEDEEDELRRRNGESDDEDSSVDEEGDAIVDAEEEMLVGEARGLDLDDESEDDDDDTAGPRRGFQARLERLRAQSKGKHHATASSQEDSDDDLDMHVGWRADEDEEYLAHIEALLDDNDQLLSRGQRKDRNRLFKAIQDGDFDDIAGLSVPSTFFASYICFQSSNNRFLERNKDKGRYIPPHLLDQWEKDRAKKAENKAKRALARLELAADPLSTKKGGKKGRKAMLAAAKLDPSIVSLPNRVVDMLDIEKQIRRFLSALGGPGSMSLPPMDKSARKSVHEIALAFNLKSVSKGKGNGRYTTLQKTTRSGVGINEAKIAKIIRRWGGQPMGRPFDGQGGQGGGSRMPKHREGDEVGKAAPKIGQSNVGFKMLAAMGWADGDRIGISGGLDAPLTAVIKNTKLGLGATM
ncbi:hypothetical protein HGRIS_003160 [Hohenbuehelia grisea]|uniref:Protein SQS1 n=1 Tax=Hohenbuehelia grisea TaxID=104357 RepID=A0ABR3JP04_9AGAR